MNGHCSTCDIEKECGYEYKPCDCCNHRKFTPRAMNSELSNKSHAAEVHTFVGAEYAVVRVVGDLKLDDELYVQPTSQTPAVESKGSGSIGYSETEKNGAPASSCKKQEAAAHRVLRKNFDGEWQHDGRYWMDGPPSADLVADVEARPGQRAIELLYRKTDPAVVVDESAFERWWQEHGQFCRAGGGDYEKTFAFHAWKAALETRGQK